MKPTAKYLLLFLVLNINTFLYCQDFWEEVFASGPTIFSMDISDDGVIYLGAANGIWKSFDNGNNWEFDTITTGNLTVYSLETGQDGIVYAGGNNKIYYSEDYGNGWSLICNGCVMSNFISLLATDQNIIYGGVMNGIIRSDDNGSSWQQVLLSNDWATTYCITESVDGTLYAGLTCHYTSQYSGIYKSVDNGITWEQIEVTSDFGIQSIDFNAEGNLITAVIWDQNWIFGGIYKYNPFENTWQCLKYGERGRAIVVNKIGDYYAGIDNELSNGGCRVSYDNGGTWESINYGLSNSNIMEMKIMPDGYLFCLSNYPAKVFRSIHSTLTDIKENEQLDQETSESKNVKLFQNIPNPFKETTKILYNSKEESNITVEIYDYSGKRIKVYTTNSRGKGIDYIEFNAVGLSPGIYFYSLKINGIVTDSKKMTILK